MGGALRKRCLMGVRVYHRVGRKAGVSVPLWMAIVVYLFVGAAIALVAAAAVAVAIVGVALAVLVLLVGAVVGRLRRR